MKTFKVVFEHTEYFTHFIEAENEKEAEEKAWKEEENGEFDEHCIGDADITDLEIIE